MMNLCGHLILNPFPHIDAFWRLRSGQLFENIVTKEEIAQNEQFLLLPLCFPLLVIGYPFNYRDFLFFLTKYVKSGLLQNCRIRERVKSILSHYSAGILNASFVNINMYMTPDIYVNICKCFNRGPQGILVMPKCAINKGFIIIIYLLLLLLLSLLKLL